MGKKVELAMRGNWYLTVALGHLASLGNSSTLGKHKRKCGLSPMLSTGISFKSDWPLRFKFMGFWDTQLHIDLHKYSVNSLMSYRRCMTAVPLTPFSRGMFHVLSPER